MRRLFLFLTLVAFAALGATPAFAGGPPISPGPQYGSDAVYTQTNDPAGNQIVVYKRAPDGTITEQTRIWTGGLGSPSAPPFGFPIVDSSGSVELTGNGKVLFVVNAGDDTISSFRISRHGLPTLVNTRPSGGDLPISLDTQGHYLYVVNGRSGNIRGFNFKGDGRFSAISGSTRSLSTPGGGGVAAQIGFAPHWGVLLVTLRGTNTIDTFKLRHDGTTGAARPNPATDDNPFGFDFRRNGTAIVSNAGKAGDPMDPSSFPGRAASYNVAPGGLVSPIDSISVTGQHATCWVVVANDQRHAFMTNTQSRTVSRFSISSNGHLTLLGNTGTGPGFASDLALSRASKFLYVLVPSIMGGSSHIDYYRVGFGGTLTQIGSTPSNLPVGVSGIAAR